MKPEYEPLLVGSREAARLLSISERTLWQHTKDGSIPSVKIGRSVRYSTAELMRWIESQSRSRNGQQTT